MEKEIIFFCEPKNFPTPTYPKGYNIEGISCYIASAVAIGNNKIPVVFTFYTKDSEGNFKIQEQMPAEIQKTVAIPNVGDTPIPSMLFSDNKETMYQAASIMGAAYGYILLSYEQQTQLIES
jgi:hypothetical protein